MPTNFDRTKKILLTIYHRYKLKPFQIERLLESGRLPVNLEYELIKKMTNTGKISNAMNNIRSEKRSVNSYIKKWNQVKNELMQKGYIYKRLPREFSYFNDLEIARY